MDFRAGYLLGIQPIGAAEEAGRHGGLFLGCVFAARSENFGFQVWRQRP